MPIPSIPKLPSVGRREGGISSISAGGGGGGSAQGLTFAPGRLSFSTAVTALDIATSAHTMGFMVKTTAADTAWQALISGETTNVPAGGISRYSIERSYFGAGDTATGQAGAGPNDAINYQKALSADAVYTGAGTAGPPTIPDSSGCLKWFASDGTAFIWSVKPAAGSSQGFCKVFTLSGTTWTEKVLSPQNYTFQIGDGTGLGGSGAIVLGRYENSGDSFTGDLNLAFASRTALTNGQINTLMVTKTTAAIIALASGTDFLVDAADNCTVDRIGARTALSRTGVSLATAIAAGAWTYGP